MGWLYSDSAVIVFADQQIVSTIKDTIKQHGFDFIQIQSLELGARQIHKHHVQLIVLDAELPGFSKEGVDLLLEKNPELKHIPVLILTNSNSNIDDFSSNYRNIEVVNNMNGQPLPARIDTYLEPSIMLKFWGVRGSTPSANMQNMKFGGNTTCVQIHTSGNEKMLILDSGTGIRNLGNHIEKHLNNIASGHLFITHPHWDHIQGFPFFKPFYMDKNSFKIHMPEQYRGGAEDILSGHMTKTFFPVTIDMFSAEIEYLTQQEEQQNYDGFSVEYMVANHATKTAMYKFRIGGNVIIFAPDNELNPNPSPIRFIDKFQDFIAGCDLLIHDGQFDKKIYQNRIGWGHSAWENIVEVARFCDVKRLYLTHHDPDSSDEKLERINKKLQTYLNNPFEEVELAREGAVVKLPLKKAVP